VQNCDGKIISKCKVTGCRQSMRQLRLTVRIQPGHWRSYTLRRSTNWDSLSLSTWERCTPCTFVARDTCLPTKERRLPQSFRRLLTIGDRAQFPARCARLGLAVAYALQTETTRANTAYQDFLAIWKDADPDIPILKEAKAEYAKLQ